MKIKRHSLCLLIAITAIMTLGLTGCATLATTSTNRWLEYELPPSRINYSGNSFMEGRLSGGSRFYVFYDEEIDNDARFYWVILRQDFGWHLDGDTWRGPSTARNVKHGHMYVNPQRRVAIYRFPDGTYTAFKVNIE